MVKTMEALFPPLMVCVCVYIYINNILFIYYILVIYYDIYVYKKCV